MVNGKTIRDFRLQYGYSIADFGRAVGITPRTLSRLEKSDEIKQKYIDKIEDKFDVELEHFKIDLSQLSFGKRIAYYRQKKGYTLSELADAVNIDASHISAIEHDVRQPSAGLLFRISEELGVNAKHLVDAPSKDATEGEKIRYCRILNGLTQSELANLLGVDTTYISRVERDITSLSDKRRKQIAKVLSFNEKRIK